ncbi:unnamed protein product [Lactuca virosa]|uniref:Uncharacterized protein n=1 Tax=Lactuca virosa TaxID=75947 RepID=A0AAU9M3C3_9ASTR|nr:unnamed protein product [Lactuca virosa]CAH1421073.1 unnamed protein product [Lactuca virosa]
MLRIRVRKDHTEIKAVEAYEDGNRPRAGNNVGDRPCNYCCEAAALQCVECMIHSGCPTNARRQANNRYQEEARALDHAATETAGTEVVDGTVLPRTDHESGVEIFGRGGHNGPRSQRGYHH